jgi:hypothetical protein
MTSIMQREVGDVEYVARFYNRIPALNCKSWGPSWLNFEGLTQLKVETEI